MSAQRISSRLVEVVINSRLSRAAALGKRKASEAFAASSSSLQHSEGSDYQTDDDANEDGDGEWDEKDSESEPSSPGSVTPRERRYACTFDGCSKAYTKPLRLAEHLRSHTGDRPYLCTTCGKSYLRDSHLQAHTRSHLPASARPHPCTEDRCEKRFWTLQHLGVHVARIHRGEKPFVCLEPGCEEAFGKHNQLRRHVAEAHCPEGTKPFRCEADGCTRSFATTQHLRKHSKVHQDGRYTCIDAKCTGAAYFPTWTALQAHMRERHPPTCPYPACGGRVFSSQKGLKPHLKVHEQRELEAALEHAAAAEGRPAKRRRGGEVGRDWACEVGGCTKTFKSKKALTTHNNITHLGRRDHVCAHAGCGATFGYKHLLQRHVAKAHPAPAVAVAVEPASEAEAEAEADAEAADDPAVSIAWLTGKRYTQRRALVPCPWPNHFGTDDAAAEGGARCAYEFSRAYDLRRHLRAVHGLELEREEVDAWVGDWRERHPEGC